MPEEPQSINPQPQPQFQPLSQIQPQPLQPQPLQQSQPQPQFQQPQVQAAEINPPQWALPKAPEAPSLGSIPQPDMISAQPESATDNVMPTPEPSGYVAHPQFPTQTQPIIASTSTIATPTAKGNKKFIVIGAIVAGVLAMLGGSGVLAYNVWYSAPEKVISDAIVNTITAKNPVYTGKLSLDSGGTKATVEITTKQFDATGSLDAKVTVTFGSKEYIVTGGALFDNAGDLYFKVGGIDAVAKDLESQYSMQIAGLDAFVAKVDNKWVKISSDDLSKYDSSLATSKTCVSDTIKKFKDDGTVLAEVTDLYKKNPFIIINKDLGQKNGSRGYEIKTDNVKSKAFTESLKTTKVYTALHSCDNTFTINTTDVVASTGSVDTTTVELWVDNWSHRLTEIKADSNNNGQKASITIDPKYNQDIKIVAPTDFVTLAQLQTEIEKLMQSIAPVTN